MFKLLLKIIRLNKTIIKIKTSKIALYWLNEMKTKLRKYFDVNRISCLILIRIFLTMKSDIK